MRDRAVRLALQRQHFRQGNNTGTEDPRNILAGRIDIMRCQTTGLATPSSSTVSLWHPQRPRAQVGFGECAEFIVIKRAGYVSYANCGQTYYAGGTIAERSKLALQTSANAPAAASTSTCT